MKNKIKSITVSKSDSIRDVMKAIGRGAIGVALLVDPKTGKFAGLLTDGDLRRALLRGKGLESPAAEVDHPDTKTATVGMDMAEISSMFSEPIRVVPILDDQMQVVDLATFDTRVNFPVAEPEFGDKELQYVNECVLSGWVSSAGKFVRQFEKQFARFCDTRYAISTTNGTTALHLSLLSLGIGPGDEVIVPSLTFIATANAVTYTGARPVFIDSEEKTWNIDAGKIEQAITERTKAIIPVHLYGHPADMNSILDIARKYDLYIIEDAAEAHGAMYKGQIAGSMGDMGIFSFYGNKIITTGEGGMVVTDSEELARKIYSLRDHGMDTERRYWHPVLGYNYRMTNIQAALGVAQMERIDRIIHRKRANAAFYNNGLKDIQGVRLPPEAAGVKNIYWLYSILIDEKSFGMSAHELGVKLKQRGIDTRPLFPPIHKQPIYNTGQCLPISEKLSYTGLSLPSSANLTTDQIRWISEIIKSIKIEG